MIGFQKIGAKIKLLGSWHNFKSALSLFVHILNRPMRDHLNHPFYLLIFLLVSSGCATKPRGVFSADTVPAKPDYALLDSWAAHPAKADSADLLPDPKLNDAQDNAGVDVFFLHPTTYTKQPGNTQWNGSIGDLRLSTKTDKYPMKYQATAFNGAGRIYAPYYRQAHIQSYFTRKKASAIQAFEVAYRDVEQAFRYYLAHENNGRPFIIAAHSQGTQHAERLIRQHVDGKPVQEKLVAAYLVGMPVRKDAFTNILPCTTEVQTNCFCSWRTWKRGHLPKSRRDTVTNVLVTNPLTWKTEGYAPMEMNKGTLLRDYTRLRIPGLTDAEVNDRVLWVNRPKFPWSFLILSRNYHIADINLFWMNIRENAIERSRAFLNGNRS